MLTMLGVFKMNCYFPIKRKKKFKNISQYKELQLNSTTNSNPQKPPECKSTDFYDSLPTLNLLTFIMIYCRTDASFYTFEGWCTYMEVWWWQSIASQPTETVHEKHSEIGATPSTPKFHSSRFWLLEIPKVLLPTCPHTHTKKTFYFCAQFAKFVTTTSHVLFYII